MIKITAPYRLIAYITSVVFVCLVLQAHAVEGSAKVKKSMKKIENKRPIKRLEVKSPDLLHSVVFSRPIASLEPQMPFWGKIEVLHKEKGKLHVVEDPPRVVQSGYEAYLPYEGGVWSPDGRYLSVWQVVDVETNKQIVGFLDVCTGRWESFEGKTKSATTDNYFGWRNDKPHTMLLIGEPPKWQDYIEAFPINNPDPDDCK